MMLCLLATIASSGQSIRVNMAVWGVAAIGIAVTFSRAGWLILVIALIGLGALGQFGRGRSRAIFVGLVFLLIAFLYYATASGELADFVKGTGLAPYLDANTVARLGASGSLIDDSSTLDRSDVLAAGWQAFLDSPILGNGLGYTFEWLQPESTHNMYVLMLAEQGVLGTLLYVSLLGALLAWSRGVFRVVAVLIAVAAFFTHDQLDQPYATAVMGVTLAALMSGGHANRQANRLWRVAGAALPAQ
jgi:O-antigen ligase